MDYISRTYNRLADLEDSSTRDSQFQNVVSVEIKINRFENPSCTKVTRDCSKVSVHVGLVRLFVNIGGNDSTKNLEF